MRISNRALNILTALTYKGVGRKWVLDRLPAFDDLEALVPLLQADARDAAGVTEKEVESRRATIEESLDALTDSADGVVAIGEEGFPPYRGRLKRADAPVVLFYSGDLSLLDAAQLNVAVIGLLNPDEHTMAFERKVVRRLVAGGARIVSGLAAGCDTVAHEETLRSGGETVAILPSPLNHVLPAGNRDLARDIVDRGGLLISEYYEQPRSRQELVARFVQRDRLQALFSDWVVLCASYSKDDIGKDSGSQHAMEKARAYGLPRAVIYDPAKDDGNPKYNLNREVIGADRSVLVINEENLSAAVEQILSVSPRANEFVPDRGLL